MVQKEPLVTFGSRHLTTTCLAFVIVAVCRCGHKEAVFFQSHSMKAQVRTQRCAALIDVCWSPHGQVLLHTLNAFVCVLTGCDETLLRLHGASLWTQMD